MAALDQIPCSLCAGKENPQRLVFIGQTSGLKGTKHDVWACPECDGAVVALSQRG